MVGVNPHTSESYFFFLGGGNNQSNRTTDMVENVPPKIAAHAYLPQEWS